MHFGPVNFKVVIPPLKGDVSTAPLFATGLPNHTDVLYLTQVRGDYAELKVVHSDYGEVKSGLIHLVPGSEHSVEVDFGSLYPPRDHPWFRGMNDDDVELLKTTAIVKLDGKEVIARRVLFFDSPPGWVSFGRNPGGVDPAFTGQSAMSNCCPRAWQPTLGRAPAKAGCGAWRPPSHSRPPTTICLSWAQGPRGTETCWH